MKKGFTLVELSIVLVIIGLLIGGILVARSIIETTKIQRLIRDLAQYEASINTFKSTYKFYPGDDPYFSIPGDADNRLVFGAAGAVACTGIYSNIETDQSFVHLSEAQMLTGNYVPYAPVLNCGGTMTNTAGVSAPYTELDATAASYLGVSKSSFVPAKLIPTFNFAITFYVNTSYVVPMETKLGTTTASPTVAVGLNNASGGPGNCFFIPFPASFVSCYSTDAKIGHFYYYITPL